MNKFPYLLAGGIAGGILGYLIADYIAYQLDEEKFDVFQDDEVESLVGGMDKELYEFDENADPAKIAYGDIRVTRDKETLEELTRPYQDEQAPYIMTADEWGDTINAFDRITILFYEMDSVYCTDQEQPILDPTNMFVPNVHLHFGEESEDPDVVFVSNPERSEMYEILRMRASYAVDVLGEVPVEPPKGVSPKKRDNQPGSQKERKKKEAEELGDVDNEIESTE